MPGHKKAKKGVISCEKLRGGANDLRSGDTRMGQPIPSEVGISGAESIGTRRLTRGTETSKYPQEEKAKAILSVAASERGIAQTGDM